MSKLSMVLVCSCVTIGLLTELITSLILTQHNDIHNILHNGRHVIEVTLLLRFVTEYCI